MRNNIEHILDISNEKLKIDWSEKKHDPIKWGFELKDHQVPVLDLPQFAGGLGCTASEMIHFFDLFGYHSLDLRDVPGAGHARILFNEKHGRNFIEYAKLLASTDAFTAIGITESGIGSDLHSMRTRAIPEPRGYILRGKKTYISRLRQATHVVVFARTDRTCRTSSVLSAFLLELTRKDIEISDMSPMGLNGVSWGEIEFHDVVIKTKDRIGGEGEGFSLFSKHFSYWRLMIAACALGSARSAIECVAHRLCERAAFGGPIGRFTHLQQELAKHVANIYQAKLLISETAKRMDKGVNCFVDSAMCKAETIETALSAVSWGMSVYGASGYQTDSGLEKKLRDLLGRRVADGTTDVLRGQVARSILGEQLYRMSIGREVITSSVSSSPNVKHFF